MASIYSKHDDSYTTHTLNRTEEKDNIKLSYGLSY